MVDVFAELRNEKGGLVSKNNQLEEDLKAIAPLLAYSHRWVPATVVLPIVPVGVRASLDH